MGYCTRTDVDRVLAQSLTSATMPQTGTKTKLMRIGTVRDTNTVSDDIVDQYIQWAGEEVDAAIGQLYNTPLCELADFESMLHADITEYNSYITLARNCPLTPGDNIIISAGADEERHEVDEVLGDGVFSTVDMIALQFEAGSRVIRVKYPDPIPFIACRLAAANVYEKYFAAQVTPNTTEYGKLMRKQARQKINDILNGRTILHGVHRIGRRLYDPTISDQYGLPKGGDSQRDIDDLG